MLRLMRREAGCIFIISQAASKWYVATEKRKRAGAEQSVSAFFELENIVEMELEDNTLNISVNGDENKLGILIGKRGVTLDSIQYILNLIVNKKSSRYIRVNLDSSGYREKRKETLINLAKKMANKVTKTGRSVKLEPMNSYERKIIHTALQDYAGVLTHSERKEPFRKVVIQKERKY